MAQETICGNLQPLVESDWFVARGYKSNAAIDHGHLVLIASCSELCSSFEMRIDCSVNFHRGCMTGTLCLQIVMARWEVLSTRLRSHRPMVAKCQRIKRACFLPGFYLAQLA